MWYADSGASDHMTGNRAWFTTLNQIPLKSWPVKVADKQHSMGSRGRNDRHRGKCGWEYNHSYSHQRTVNSGFEAKTLLYRNLRQKGFHLAHAKHVLSGTKAGKAL
jgi:hypothetical protein